MLKQILNSILRPLLAAGMAVIMSNNSTSGCVPLKDVQAPLDGPYVAETAQCVVVSQTLSESRLCRAGVNHRYGLCPNVDKSLPCP